MTQLICKRQEGNPKWEELTDVVRDQDELSGYIWLKMAFAKVFNDLCIVTKLSLSLPSPKT